MTNLPLRESWSSLFILDNRKRRTPYLKDDDGKLLVEVIIFTLDAVATVDVLKANNNDVNLINNRTVHFARLFNRRLVLKE